MKEIYSLIIFVIYPLRAFYQFLPYNKMAVYVLSGFEISMLFTGMHFFNLGYNNILIIIPALFILYIPAMIIINNPVNFSISKIIKSLMNWPLFIIKEYTNSRNIILKATEEELIWRSAFVNLSILCGIDKLVIILFGSVLFFVAHLKTDDRTQILREAEFIIFSMFLFYLYLSTNSLLVVIVIHFLRNSFLICFQQIIVKTELKY